MELHLALKNIVNLSGTSILKEQRLVNILADFNAYDDVPSAKFIIKTIIGEGYMDKLLANGKWDINCDKLIDKFVEMTGMVKENVRYAFESIGYSNGWNNVNPIKNTPIKPNASSHIAIGERLPCSVDVINPMQGNCKLMLKNPTAALAKKGVIIVSCEIHGVLKDGWVNTYCSIYVDNTIIQTNEITKIYASDFTGFTIASSELKIKYEVEKITRIVIYIGS